MESVGIGSLDWTWGHFRSLPASLELQGLQMFAFLLNPIVPRGTEQSRTDSWDAALLLYTLLVIYIPDERRKHRNFGLRSAEMDWAKQNSFITTLEMLLQPNVGLSWRGIHYHLFVIFFLCMCVFVILVFSFTVESFLYIFTNIVPILLSCMEIHIYC